MDCIFCKIVSGEVPTQRVHETENTIVIKDINPKAPVHDLVIPKKHIGDLGDLKDEKIASELLFSAKKAAEIGGVSEDGYRLIINTKKAGGQLVPHLHFHLLGGRDLGPKIVAE